MSNEIIQLPNIPKHAGLTNEKALQIAGALQRLEELKVAGPAILAPNEIEDKNQAEAKATIEFLANELIENAGELLGAFFIIRSEYEPLVKVFKPFINRVGAHIAQDRKAAAERAKQGASQ